MRMLLYSLCVPSGFGGRAGFDMTTIIFPKGLLAAITLVGSQVEMEEVGT